MTRNEVEIIYKDYKHKKISKIRNAFIKEFNSTADEEDISNDVKSRLIEFIKTADDDIIFEIFAFYKCSPVYTLIDLMTDLIDSIEYFCNTKTTGG